VRKLKAIHVMCKRDTESVKVVPESVLSDRGNFEGTYVTRFSPGGISWGYFQGGLSPYTAVVRLCQ